METTTLQIITLLTMAGGFIFIVGLLGTVAILYPGAFAA